MRAIFKKIDKSVIHKSKITDKHTVVVSLGYEKDDRKCLLVPTSSYNHGMNSSCTTKNFTAITIDEKGLQPSKLEQDEKNLKEWTEYCEKKNYLMDVFNSLKEAINSIF